MGQQTSSDVATAELTQATTTSLSSSLGGGGSVQPLAPRGSRSPVSRTSHANGSASPASPSLPHPLPSIAENQQPSITVPRASSSEAAPLSIRTGRRVGRNSRKIGGRMGNERKMALEASPLAATGSQNLSSNEHKDSPLEGSTPLRRLTRDSDSRLSLLSVASPLPHSPASPSSPRVGIDEKQNPLVYPDVEIFYANQGNKVDWEKGIVEIRRLLCALKFLVDEHNIETDLLDTGGMDHAYDSDPLVCTVASGAKTTEEFRKERARLLEISKIRHAAERKRIKTSRKKEGESEPHDSKQQLVHRDSHQLFENNDHQDLKGVEVGSVICSEQDFVDFVPAEMREREHLAYEIQWQLWQKHQKASVNAKRARQGLPPLDDHHLPPVFDPDLDVSEFEGKSYTELIKFLFTRAPVASPFTGSNPVQEALFARYNVDLKTGRPLSGQAGVAFSRPQDDRHEANATAAKTIPPKAEAQAGDNQKDSSDLEISPQQAKSDYDAAMRTQTTKERALIHFMVAKLRRFIIRLRKLEAEPRGIKELGNEFLYKIDNFLAILLFRRKNALGSFPGQTEQQLISKHKTEGQRAIQRQRELEAQEHPERTSFWQDLASEAFQSSSNAELLDFIKVGLPPDSSLVKKKIKSMRTMLRDETEQSIRAKHRSRLTRFCIFGFFLLTVVALSVAGLYGIFLSSSNYALQAVAHKLRVETEKTMVRTLNHCTSFAMFNARFVASLIDSGDLNLTALSFNSSTLLDDPQLQLYDQVLAEQIQLANTSALFIATEEGYYIAAITKSRLTSSNAQSSWLVFDTYIRQLESLQQYTTHITVYNVSVFNSTTGMSSYENITNITQTLSVDAICLYEYQIDSLSRFRDLSTRTLLYCPYLNGSLSGFTAAPAWDPRFSVWYLQAAQPNPISAATVASVLSAVSIEQAAVLAGRLAGEGWSHSYQLFENSPTTGLTFTTPVYSAFVDEMILPIFTPNSVVDIGNASTNSSFVELQLQAVVGSNVDYPTLQQQMSHVKVGVTGVSYLGDANSTAALLVVRAQSSQTTTAQNLVASSVSYLQQLMRVGGNSAAFLTTESLNNCTSLPTANPNVQFSDAQLEDIELQPLITLQDSSVILSALNFSSLLPQLVSASLPSLSLPLTWTLVTVIPSSDYFGVITSNSISSLAVGLLAVFFACLLLFFVRVLIPDMNKLKKKLEQYDLAAKEERNRRRLEKQHTKRRPSIGDRLSTAFTKLRRSMSRKKTDVDPVSPRAVDFTEPDQVRPSQDDSSEINSEISRSSSLSRSKRVRKLVVSYGTVFGREFPPEAYTFGLVFCLLLVIVCILLITFIWSSSSNNVSFLASNLLTEAQIDTYQLTSDFTTIPTTIQAINLLQYQRSSALPLSGNITYLPGNSVGADDIIAFLPYSEFSPGQFSYDKYFFELISTFQQADGSYIAMSIYAIFANGDYAGASIYTSPTGVQSIVVTAKDAYNNNCLTTYGTTGAGLRNTADVISVSGGCVTDPRTLSYYEASVTDGAATGSYDAGYSVEGWTPVYTTGNQLLSTCTVPILNSTGAVLGVFAVDIDLNILSTRLQVSQQVTSCFARYFVIQETSEFVGSSVSPVIQSLGTDNLGNPITFPLQSFSAPVDATEQAAATFFNQIPGGIFSLNGTGQQQWAQPLGYPYTGSQSLSLDNYKASSSGSPGLNWIVICLVPYDVFVNQFNQYETLATVFLITVLLIIVLLIRSSYQNFHKKLLDQEEAQQTGLQYGALRFLKAQQDNAEVRSDKIRREDESQEDWEQRSLTELMHKIRPTIQQAAAYRFNRQRFAINRPWQSPVVQDVRLFCAHEGVRHILNSIKGRDILTLSNMEERPSSAPRRLYKLYTSSFYTNFVMIVLCVHVLLAFFEPNTYTDLQTQGESSTVSLVELACILIECFDIVIGLLINITWRNPERAREYIQILREKARQEGGETAIASLLMAIRLKYNLVLNKDLVLDFVYIGIEFAVIFDWIMKLGARISFSYYFPIRVLLILFRSYSMRRTGESFLLTLKSALHIVFFYALNVTVLATFALVLFSQSVTSLPWNQVGTITNYNNFFNSIVTTFVYISTADNYIPLVYDAKAVSPFFMIYFIIATVSGTFFILGMIVATFQNGFQRLGAERAQKSLLFSRTGIVAAFILLDLNGSERLGWNELQTFIDTLRPIIGEDDPQLIAAEERLQAMWEQNNREAGYNDSAIVKKFLRLQRTGSKVLLTDELKKLTHQAVHEEEAHEDLLRVRKRLATAEMAQQVMAEQDSAAEEEQDDIDLKLQRQKELQMAAEEAQEEVGMSVAQFVSAVEKIKWEKKAFTKDINKINKLRQWLQVRVFERTFYHDFAVGLVIAQMCVVGIFGTVPSQYQPLLYWLLLGLFFAQGVEISARCLTYGFSEFWYYRVYHPGFENKYMMLANRFDFVMLQMMILGFLVSFIWAGGTVNFSSSDGPNQSDNLLHYTFISALPILRIFAHLKKVRRLFFTLLGILPNFLDLIAILISLIFVFTTICVNLFAYKFTTILQTNSPDGNFDGIRNAFYTAFQMLTGQNWSNFMWAGITVSRNWSVAWVFMLWMLLGTLLFINIFIGLVIESYDSVNAESLAEQKAQAEERLAEANAHEEKIKEEEKLLHDNEALLSEAPNRTRSTASILARRGSFSMLSEHTPRRPGDKVERDSLGRMKKPTLHRERSHSTLQRGGSRATLDTGSETDDRSHTLSRIGSRVSLNLPHGHH